MTPFRGTFLLASLLAACGGEASIEDRPPNVLLIVADDQGFADLGAAGLAADVATPALDALAARGVRFTQAYASSPICNPSRAGLMTGVHQQRFGCFWYGGEGLRDARFPTIAETLREHGYVTGYVGKFHYGSEDLPGKRSFPLEHGFDSLYGFAGGRKHYLVHSAAAEDAWQAVRQAHARRGQSLQQGPFWVDDRQEDQPGFSTELLGARAREFLAANADEAFFLTLAFNAVHNFTHQLPQEYLDEHGLAGYRDWDPATEEYYDWYRAGRKPNNPEGRAQYLGQLHYLDREVGRVLAALDELGLAERTLVIYVGDNGGSTPIYADNGPLRGGKYTLYEGGIRVPLIVAWPGRIQAGTVRDEMVSALDLYPTICTAAGATAPQHLEGFDLRPLLRGGDEAWPARTLFWDTGKETAVRSGNWKLRTAMDKSHADYEMVELELGTFLYDLQADPGESTDLSAAEPERLAELLATQRAWKASVGE
ncbi:MAG TPA: sulfatase-like hydrolase/transferase [Planctomycetota bacterium]